MNYQENLNKKKEETRKKFEKMFGGECTYHEEDKWGRTNGIFTIKSESLKKYEKNKDSWVGGVFDARCKKAKEIDEWDRVDAEFKEIEAKWDQRKEEQKKWEIELGIPSAYSEKHSFSSWNNDGAVDMEGGIYIKPENQSLIILEKKGINPPQIQEITDEEVEHIKEEQNKEVREKGNFQINKKLGNNQIGGTENKDSVQPNKKKELQVQKDNSNWGSKSLIWGGVGVIFLLGLVGVYSKRKSK